MRFVPRPQPVEYEEAIIDPNAEVRLNKFMANAGVCSRREADELITKGLVKVNGEVVTELGVKITAKDTVEYNDKIVTSERKIYILLNKPKDCVTTSDDPNGRKTVMDIVKGACEERIYQWAASTATPQVCSCSPTMATWLLNSLTQNS